MDIGYIIEHHGDEYPYKTATADEHGYRGAAATRTIVGYFDISTLKDAINPGSATFYTRDSVEVGGRVDYFGKEYEIVSKTSEYAYDVQEKK